LLATVNFDPPAGPESEAPMRVNLL